MRVSRVAPCIDEVVSPDFIRGFVNSAASDCGDNVIENVILRGVPRLSPANSR